MIVAAIEPPTSGSRGACAYYRLGHLEATYYFSQSNQKQDLSFRCH